MVIEPYLVVSAKASAVLSGVKGDIKWLTCTAVSL